MRCTGRVWTLDRFTTATSASLPAASTPASMPAYRAPSRVASSIASSTVEATGSPVCARWRSTDCFMHSNRS